MSIVIEQPPVEVYSLYASDFKDGHAYQGTDGTIYIGNGYNNTVFAFSVDGRHVITNSSSETFREINLRIIVE